MAGDGPRWLIDMDALRAGCDKWKRLTASCCSGGLQYFAQRFQKLQDTDGNTAKMETPVMSRAQTREGLGSGFTCAGGALRWLASSWRHCHPNRSQPYRSSSEGSCQPTFPTHQPLSPATYGTVASSFDVLSSSKEEQEAGPSDVVDPTDPADPADQADRADRIDRPDRPGIASTVSSNTSHIPWGDITVRGKIGEGGQSKVYHGRWSGADVAVKVLRALESPQAREALRREVEALTKLRHPRICSLFGFSEIHRWPDATPDRPEPHTVPKHAVLVLEYMPCTLFQLLRSRPYAELRGYVQEIASDTACALAHMHELGFIHRDVKPTNVLITETLNAKLSDFGISKSLSGRAEAEEHTPAMGTLRYMAPEVIKGGRYDSSCDVYSFGLVLWEMIHPGHIAFGQYNAVTACEAAMRGERPSLINTSRNDNSAVADEVEALFIRLSAQCWASFPHERMSMVDVAMELHQEDDALAMGCRLRPTLSSLLDPSSGSSVWSLPDEKLHTSLDDELYTTKLPGEMMWAT